jgi:hypothetical protein
MTAQRASDGRKAEAQKTMYVKSAGFPTVFVLNQKGMKINSDTKLELQAEISSSLPATAVWTIDSPDVILDSIALTPTSRSFAFTSGLKQRFDLAVAKSSFVTGKSYTFSLAITQSTGSFKSSLGSFVVLTNEAPVLGSVIVNPTSGYAITSNF